jgi:surfeit locus 1 family protein
LILSGFPLMTALDNLNPPPPAGPARRWAPVVAVWLLVPVFLALGYWQLQRADEKRRLQEEYDSRAGVLVRVEPRLQSVEALRFYRVEVSGVYEPDRQFLLDNRVHHGRAGYHVVTPLKIGDSDVRVLVNRGWVALGESRDKLPVIDTPGHAVTLTGLAMVPSEKGYRLAEPNSAAKTWPPVWLYLDLKRFGRAVTYPVQPVVILLDEGHASGFAREWSRLDAGIAVHQGYAFQWFALAVALTGLYFVLRWRRSRSPDST